MNRISHSGSTAQANGIPETMVSRILGFMRSWAQNSILTGTAGSTRKRHVGRGEQEGPSLRLKSEDTCKYPVPGCDMGFLLVYLQESLDQMRVSQIDRLRNEGLKDGSSHTLRLMTQTSSGREVLCEALPRNGNSDLILKVPPKLGHLWRGTSKILKTSIALERFKNASPAWRRA